MTNYDVMKLALELLALERKQYPHMVKGYCIGTITALQEALANQPTPPPECQTEAEKTAYAFGWWKALEHIRMKNSNKRKQKMIEKIKTAPLSVKIAMAILGLLFLVLMYFAPIAVILITACLWSIHKVIDYFVDGVMK